MTFDDSYMREFNREYMLKQAVFMKVINMAVCNYCNQNKKCVMYIKLFAKYVCLRCAFNDPAFIHTKKPVDILRHKLNL